MKSDQTVQCDVLTHCWHLYMLYEWVFCSHTPSVIGKFISQQPKLVLNSEKTRIVRPRRMPRISTSRRPIVTVPFCWRGRMRQVSLWLWTIEPPAGSRIVAIVVLVDSFEYLSLRSRDCWSRGIGLYSCWVIFTCSSCILLHSRVDSVVVEHRLDSTCLPNVSYFEFFQVLLRKSCHVQ